MQPQSTTGVACWVPRKADSTEETSMQEIYWGTFPGKNPAGSQGSRAGQRSWAALQSHQRPQVIVPFVPSHGVIGCGLSQEQSMALKRHLSSAAGNHQQVGPNCKLSIVNTPSRWGRSASAVQGFGRHTTLPTTVPTTVPTTTHAQKSEKTCTWAQWGAFMGGFLDQGELKRGCTIMGTF